MEITETIATITLVLMLVIGAISAVLALKKSKSGEPNYRVFYITGLILLPIGIIWIGASFFLNWTQRRGIEPFTAQELSHSLKSGSLLGNQQLPEERNASNGHGLRYSPQGARGAL